MYLDMIRPSVSGSWLAESVDNIGAVVMQSFIMYRPNTKKFAPMCVESLVDLHNRTHVDIKWDRHLLSDQHDGKRFKSKCGGHFLPQKDKLLSHCCFNVGSAS